MMDTTISENRVSCGLEKLGVEYLTNWMHGTHHEIKPKDFVRDIIDRLYILETHML
jgi:hypothetical protein